MNMTLNTKANLITCLENGNFEEIIGTPESSWVDFKRAQYPTIQGRPQKLSEYGKSELCKDVAAFANNDGGIILLGISEELSLSNGLSVASEIHEIDIANIDLAHYKQTVIERIYPLIQGIEMRWFETNPSKGILAIIIPSKNLKLHIIRQVYNEDDKRIRGIEIPVRIDDQTFIHNAESISELFCNHISLLTAGESSDRGDSSHYQESLNNVDPHRVSATESRTQLLNTLEMNDEPTIIIQAIPCSTVHRLDGFYDQIRQNFTRTSPVRSMGFNLNSIGYETTTEEGALIKAGTRPAGLRLDPNGTLTMILKADTGLLGWGVNNGTSNQFHINPVVLVEMTYEFVRFIYSTLWDKGLESWEYYIEARNLRSGDVALAPGRPSNMFWSEHNETATSDNIAHTIESSGLNGSDTYRILEEIYSIFTLSSSSIPFLSNNEVTDDTIRSIDANG
jgi:hypothetical protein